MLRRATAQMRHKSEVLPACSEDFSHGKFVGKAVGMTRSGGEQGFHLL